jgi:hypothetical protein
MPACMKLAVAGPTARVGSRVVELLEASGHDVVPMSRSTGVVTGEGLAEALAGVECVIEVAGGNAASPAGSPRPRPQEGHAGGTHPRTDAAGCAAPRVRSPAYRVGTQGDVAYVRKMRSSRWHPGPSPNQDEEAS